MSGEHCPGTLLAKLPYLLELDRTSFRALRSKLRPEDFTVEEIPAYLPSGEGTHRYFWIEKRQRNTADVAALLARALHKPRHEIGYAGRKDLQAVTRQWFSVEHVDESCLQQLKLEGLGDGIRILEHSQHRNKLKLGHARGNRFKIVLRMFELDETQKQLLTQRTAAILMELFRRGIPNYFGPQRFGREGGNAELGRLLVLGDVPGYRKRAQELRIPGARVKDRRFKTLLVNAYQAGLFNAVLAQRMSGSGIERLIQGELAWLHRNGAVFNVESLDAEQLRCATGEISPSGPLFGPKMALPQGEALELELRVLAQAEVQLDDFGRPSAERQRGARRPLRVFFLEPPQTHPCIDGIELRFALPSGSYATVVLRELFGEPDTEDAVMPEED